MKQKENPNFMEIIRTYGNIIKKYAPDHPLAAFRMIKAGLALEQFRSRNLADKKLPRCLPVSEHLCRRGSTGSTETSGNFRLGKYFCPGGAAAMLWSAQPVHRMSVFISVRIYH